MAGLCAVCLHPGPTWAVTCAAACHSHRVGGVGVRAVPDGRTPPGAHRRPWRRCLGEACFRRRARARSSPSVGLWGRAASLGSSIGPPRDARSYPAMPLPTEARSSASADRPRLRRAAARPTRPRAPVTDPGGLPTSCGKARRPHAGAARLASPCKRVSAAWASGEGGSGVSEQCVQAGCVPMHWLCKTHVCGKHTQKHGLWVAQRGKPARGTD
jgi:hypothetical protein